MASFPSGLASFAGFTASHTLAVDNHAAQHNLEQGEILAVQTKVGTGSSTPAANTVLTGTGAGTSSWAQVNLTTMVTGTLPVTNGGTGTTTSTGSGSTVLSTSPTLTTPIITDFTNATHTHQTSATGGVLDDRALLLRNNQNLQAANSTSVATNLLKLGSDNYLRLSQLPYQSNTTNSAQTDVIIQSGWGFISGAVANSITKTVTFPVAFSTILAANATIMGFNNAADPTSITDFPTTYGYDIVTSIGNLTASSFTVALRTADANNFAAGQRWGYSWVAIGTKA